MAGTGYEEVLDMNAPARLGGITVVLSRVRDVEGELVAELETFDEVTE